MKYKILGNFNPLKDRLNESNLRSMEYDIGELHEYIKKFHLINISVPDSRPNILYFNLRSEAISRKRKYTLIFVPDFSIISLEKVAKLKTPRENCFYYIDHPYGDFGIEIIALMKKKSILPLNFLELFRQSHFTEWKIIVLYGSEFKLNSIVLNTLLALGAGINEEKRPRSMKLLKNITLSFQHSIDLFQLK